MITLLAILGWIAWGGGIFLFIQLLLTVFGGDFDSADTDVDVGDVDGSEVDTDSGAGVRLFSLLGISAFGFMFGLAGRYCILTLGLHWSISMFIAAIVGLLVMYLVGWLFYKAKSLESNGVTRIKNTVDCSGTVYLPFKDNEHGTVHIDVHGIMREYDAKASDDNEFKVGDSVTVVKAHGNFVEVIKNGTN